MNKFEDKVYKRTRTDYRKPRVNSFTTRVKDDKYRKNQSDYKERKDRYRQNGGRKDKDRQPGDTEDNRYPCRACKEYTYTILLECLVW